MLMLPIPYESGYIRTNGIRLHVVSAGPTDGKPVMLLHGFPEFWYGWRRQIPALAQAGFRVIVPDQRGYNLSDVPKGVKAYALPQLGADVLGLLDHFGIDKVNLVGHDWGALVAWGVALAFPERVERLGILNVPHPLAMLRLLSRSPRQWLKSWYVGYFQIPGLADRQLAWNHFALVAKSMTGSAASQTFSPADMDAYRQAWATSGGLSGMLNWYRALVRYRPAFPAQVRLRMPVLIQWGRRDAFLSPRLATDSLALCDDGRLVFYEQASHWVQHEAASAVNRQLIEFF